MEVRKCLTTKWYDLVTVYLDNQLYAIARNHQEAQKAFSILVRECLQDYVSPDIIRKYLDFNFSVEAISCLQLHLDNPTFDKEFLNLLPEHSWRWKGLCDDVSKKYWDDPEFQLGVDGEESHWDWVFSKIDVPKELLNILEIEGKDVRNILLYPLKNE